MLSRDAPQGAICPAAGAGIESPSTFEPSQTWGTVIESRPASPFPLPPPVVEEAWAEDSCVDQKTVDLETPQASPTVEGVVEIPAEEDSLPDRGDQKAQKSAVDEDGMQVTGEESEEQKEQDFEREGYGICMDCGDV